MKEERFFEMTFDESGGRRWEIAVGNAASPECWSDAWALTDCNGYCSNNKVEFIVSCDGIPVDFNMVALFNIPVVSSKFGDIISKMCDGYVQRIPVKIKNCDGWEVLKVLHCVDCLDLNRSLIDYYPADLSDPWVAMNPERAGCPRGIRRLSVEPQRCAGMVLFRIRKWEVPIIVGGALKSLIEREGLTGVKFIEV